MTPREALRRTSSKAAWSALAIALLTALTAILTAHVSDENKVQWPAGAKCTPAGACSCYVEHEPASRP